MQGTPQFLSRLLGFSRSKQQEELWARLEIKPDSSYEWATKGEGATEGLGQTRDVAVS